MLSPPETACLFPEIIGASARGIAISFSATLPSPIVHFGEPESQQPIRNESLATCGRGSSNFIDIDLTFLQSSRSASLQYKQGVGPEIDTVCVLKVGGGGGSRTRVRKASALGSTCLAVALVFSLGRSARLGRSAAIPWVLATAPGAGVAAILCG